MVLRQFIDIGLMIAFSSRSLKIRSIRCFCPEGKSCRGRYAKIELHSFQHPYANHANYQSHFFHFCVDFCPGKCQIGAKKKALLTLDSAINKAGRQRMLTQRILKSWLLIGQDVATDTAQEQLDQGIGLFETQLEELETFAPTPSIQNALTNVRSQWVEFRQRAIAIPEKKKAFALIEDGNQLLAACETVVTQLEQYAHNTKGKLINVSGRQRMLSQRIGMYYAAHSWGVGNPATAEQFDHAVSEFDQALSRLQQSQLNSVEIGKALDKVASQWEFSRSGFQLMNNGRFVPFVIQATTESMLGKMDKITHMYEQLDTQSVAAK